MKAVCVHRFGGLETLVYEELTRPVPVSGQVLVRVRAAGVGPWDAWVRAGKSALPQPLPLVLGSDLSGVVEKVGPGVSGFHSGEEVFGVTNSRFTGAYAEYAVVDAAMIAPMPKRLNYVEAASVPVAASTAWQMVFDHGHVDGSKRVLVHGAAGNVGAYAVQLAKRAGAEVIATVRSRDVDFAHSLRPDRVIDVQTATPYKGGTGSVFTATSLCLHRQNDLAPLVGLAGQHFVGQTCFGERKHLADIDFDLPGIEQIGYSVQALRCDGHEKKHRPDAGVRDLVRIGLGNG